MLSTILLSLVLSPSAPTTSAPFVAIVADEEVDSKIAAAGDDVKALETLATSFEEADDDASARLVYKRILELDTEHEAAHKALRHHFYDGQWFTSYASLSKYRRAEAKRMKEEFGKVRYNDEWVLETDLPFLRMGWVKEGDTFINPAKRARAEEAAKLTAEGYQKRAEDGTWVPEDEFSYWRDGLFKVGGEWVTKSEANEYHSQLGQWWRYEGEHYVANSTCDVDATAWVLWWADKTYDDMVRLFGVEPEEKPVFACLKSLQQYNTFAAGDQAAGVPQSETGGFSSFHYAYFADIWFNVVNQSIPEYVGGGVGYYDLSDEQMRPWGQFSVRHAAALSFAENIDRSWNTVSQFLTNQGSGLAPDAIWAEKRIPRWMVYGAGAYAERFMQDKDDVANGGDGWGTRNWAIEQIKNNGPINHLADIFAFNLDINDLDGSGRLIFEAGLVTSFILDGECAPVTKAHAAFKEAMRGDDRDAAKAAAKALEQAVIENEDALIAYAGVTVGPVEPEVEAAAGDAAGSGGDASGSASDGGQGH